MGPARRWTWWIAVALVLGAGEARADVAAAQALFDEGRRLMGEGQVAEGCAKLAESQRLDPSPGTLGSLADCHERQGKTATAWAEYLATEAMATARGRDTIANAARDRASSLASRLSHVLVTVATPVDGLAVYRDGEKLEAAAFGTKIPVDPGDHVIRAEAEGYRPWLATVRVSDEGALVEVTVPALVALPKDSVSPPGQTEASAPRPPPPPRDSAAPRKDDAGSAQRIIGWTAVGVGIAGLGVGVVFELQRSSKLRDRDAICSPGQDCTVTVEDKARIESLTHDATSAATIEKIGFVAGGAFAVGGLVLVFTAPAGKATSNGVTVTPVATPGFQGVTVAGRVW